MADTLATVRTALVNAGIVVSACPCFIGYAPDAAYSKLITLSLTGGEPEDTHLGENRLTRFQLRAKAPTYSECLALWEAAYAALNNTNIGFALIHALQSAPVHFTDGKLEHNMTTTFRVVEVL